MNVTALKPARSLDQSEVLRGHDLGDAMDRLIKRASQPQGKQAERE